jgi:hypothetical protein
MRGPRWWVLIGCFVMAVGGASAARAGGGGTLEGGTITFVGAVVEPTCSVAAMPGDMSQVVSAAQAHQSLQRNCSGAETAAAAAGASRPYDVNVVHLSDSESDQVLRYFANYVRAAEPSSADPVLVTQTYE